MFGLLMMCMYQNMGIWDIPVELTGKVVEAGWGWEECSLWKYELITLWTSGGGKKRCAVPRVREPGSPGDCPSILSHPSAVLWVEVPSGGGDRYLHHPVRSEELMFRCQWVCWVSSGLLLFP